MFYFFLKLIEQMIDSLRLRYPHSQPKKDASAALYVTKALVTALLVVIAGAGCAMLKTVEAKRYFDYDGMIMGGEEVSGLSLALRPSPESWSKVIVCIKNEHDRPIVINGQFVVDRGQFDSSPNLTFILEELASGRRIQLKRNQMTQERGGLASWSFRTLAPNEYYRMVFDLRSIYKINKMTLYRVYAEYQNDQTGYDKGFGGWVEMQAWTGALRSNRINLQPSQ